MELELAVPASADAAGLARIAAEAFPDPWDAATFAAELAAPHTRALLARRPGAAAPVGYVLGWRQLERVEILSFAVAPAWRRRGVGRRLLAAYLERLRAEAVEELWLEVRVSNLAARRLYEGLGLVQQGERPRFYPGGETALLFGTAL